MSDDALLQDPRCRGGCGRPLTAPASVLAGYGPRCAARRLAEAADGPSAAQTAVSLIAAHLAPIENAEYGALLEGADTVHVARLLAAAIALALGRDPHGPEYLQRVGLAAAAGVEGDG